MQDARRFSTRHGCRGEKCPRQSCGWFELDFPGPFLGYFLWASKESDPPSGEELFNSEAVQAFDLACLPLNARSHSVPWGLRRPSAPSPTLPRCAGEGVTTGAVKRAMRL